jgi:hypothetical protein
MWKCGNVGIEFEIIKSRKSLGLSSQGIRRPSIIVVCGHIILLQFLHGPNKFSRAGIEEDAGE